MGVILATIILTSIITLVIGLISWFVILRSLHSNKAKKIILTIIVLVSGIGLLFPVGSFLWNSTVTKGINVPIGQYPAIGPRLPIRVKKVTYYSNNAGTEALFKVSEQDFINWAKSNGWKYKEITGNDTVDLFNLNINKTISDGLKIEEMFHPRGTGVYISFDRKTNDCFFYYANY